MRIDELIRQFYRFGDPGVASTLAVTEHDAHAFMWDHEWALIAYRRHDSDVFIYDGWHGYSPTTSDHMNRLDPDHDRFVATVHRGQTVENCPEQPGYKGLLGSKEFDADGRAELADFGDEIVP